MKAALPPSKLLSLAAEPGFPHRYMIRPHLLMKKQLTSTASSSSSTATRRTPAMMPVDRADSSPRSAGERGEGDRALDQGGTPRLTSYIVTQNSTPLLGKNDFME